MVLQGWPSLPLSSFLNVILSITSPAFTLGNSFRKYDRLSLGVIPTANILHSDYLPSDPFIWSWHIQTGTHGINPVPLGRSAVPAAPVGAQQAGRLPVEHDSSNRATGRTLQKEERLQLQHWQSQKQISIYFLFFFFFKIYWWPLLSQTIWVLEQKCFENYKVLPKWGLLRIVSLSTYWGNLCMQNIRKI